MNKTNKTVVIFNAPASSGKDVSADFMLNYFKTGLKASFKDALYEDTAKYFDIDVKDLKHLTDIIAALKASKVVSYVSRANQ